ncbi:hypothetical protein PV08_00959 [Exophiala spinifera]|uniref:Tyrosine specific protein phosphatases domain-containing protein n=1 Tax=Exophiala spinifera TaxID=91928 RepID=A0A0D2C9Z2_9EURO|nr:uncharacterized protein PV08_00959 [Exophiala spinifera]KIW20384.1 hypothetical protein PV08_00959 [Exophiala spinifera]
MAGDPSSIGTQSGLELGTNNEIPNADQPYQPFMDVRPPTHAGISDANGSPLTEREVLEVERREREERQATPEPEDFSIAFPEDLPTPPFLHVQGVPNFRDLGGYACKAPSAVSAGGGDGDDGAGVYVLRKGILYRCAHPTHLTQPGAEYLIGTLGVRDMYDLRSQPEISRLAATVAAAESGKEKSVYPLADAQTGCLDRVPGLSRHFTPVYQSEDYGPVALATKLAWYTAEHAHDEDAGFSYSEGFVKAYRDIAVHGAAAYGTIFRHLLEKPGAPLVFHCTAGKDRTGVFAALVARLVGVPDEVICWEYALTEPGLGSWRNEFIDRICSGGLGSAGARQTLQQKQQQQQQPQDGPPPRVWPGEQRPKISREAAARICGSRAGNMRAFLKMVLDRELGSVEQYLSERCGFSEVEIERLRASLVEKVAEGEVVRQCEIKGWTADGGVEN